MRTIAVLGTGMVGRSIATKLVELGHPIIMGSRSADNQTAKEWADGAGEGASSDTFAAAAASGEIVFVCTKGDATLDALRQAKPGALAGKVVIDVTNPLDVSQGMPPTLLSDRVNTTSQGEAIQELLPESKVVKTLNIVNHEVMVEPGLAGDGTMFVCGNDDAAKQETTELLRQFGWTDIIDLGDIAGSRGLEMILPLWLRVWSTTGTDSFAWKVARK